MDGGFPDDPIAPPARPEPPTVPNWLLSVFAARSATAGGIFCRSVHDAEREVGREVFIAEVRRRKLHLVECGGQFVVICNAGHLQVLC